MSLSLFAGLVDNYGIEENYALLAGFLSKGTAFNQL